TTMRRPVAAVPGTTSYHYAGAKAVNLSHYSTTCIDPSNPGLLWTCQAYSNSKKNRQWCTAWAAFQLSDVKRLTSGKSSATFPSKHEPRRATRRPTPGTWCGTPAPGSSSVWMTVLAGGRRPDHDQGPGEDMEEDGRGQGRAVRPGLRHGRQAPVR